MTESDEDEREDSEWNSIASPFNPTSWSSLYVCGIDVIRYGSKRRLAVEQQQCFWEANLTLNLAVKPSRNMFVAHQLDFLTFQSVRDTQGSPMS